MKIGERLRNSAPSSPALPSASEIEEAFHFLVAEFGFRRAGVRRGDDEISVTFKNATTGIKVSAARDKVGLTIGRLDRAGRMLAFERDDWSYWWWIAQDLVPTRAEGERLARHDRDIHGLLVEHARALRAYGELLLRGDFAAVEGKDWWNARHG